MWLGAIVTVSLIAGLVLAWAPLGLLLRYLLPDDSFYYFVVGRNIAAGLGSTFDRIAPTNGYHPLWMVPVTIVFWLSQDRMMAIRLILSLCAMLGAIAVWQFFRLAVLLNVDRNRALIATALFALVYLGSLCSSAINGLETSLSVVLTLAYLSIVVIDLSSGDRRSLMRGLCIGLLFLARTDNIFLIGIGETLLLMKSGLATNLRKSAIAWVVAMVISAPWLAWCWWEFGSIVQVSGKSTMVMVHQTVSASWTAFNYAEQLIKNLADLFCDSFAVPVTTKTSIWFPISIVLIGALLGLALIRPSIRTENRYTYERPLLGILGAYVVVFVTMHTWRLIHPRPWYYCSLIPLVWLAVARLMCRMSPLRIAAFSGVIVAFSGGLWLVILSSPGWGEAPIRPQIARTLASEMPAGSRIGVFNAGTIAYFDEANQIVNLDGLVNNSAYAYIKKNDLCEYFLAAGIDAVGDDASTLETWKSFFNGNGPACVEAGKRLGLNGAGEYWILETVKPVRSVQRD